MEAEPAANGVGHPSAITGFFVAIEKHEFSRSGATAGPGGAGRERSRGRRPFTPGIRFGRRPHPIAGTTATRKAARPHRYR